ncbi:sodium:proton antiporter [Gammaproteobacteria bacterium]|nr:sodium:proton antiporter [Gammaproteobacteria bacterium]
MNDLQISMMILSTATLLGYISSQHLRTQPSVGILFISLICIIALKLSELFYGPLVIIEHATNWITTAKFHELLLDLMLPVLLFAGAASLKSTILKKHALEIGVLASASTLLSFVIIGSGFYYLLTFIGLDTPWLYCLLFGALISPTDPVAVIGMLKYAKTPASIEAKVAGESLFNDGIGIVIFLTLYEITFQNSSAITISSTLLLFAREFFGGIAAGVLSGYLAQRLIAYEKFDPHTNILISLFIVSGVYTVCNLLHISGPLAMVCAGIMISDSLNDQLEAKTTLSSFWGTLEEILNMFLYLLIGLESLELSIGYPEIQLCIGVIILALATRVVTILLPVRTILSHKNMSQTAERILIWGGLRGGLAIALALSLPNSEYTNTLLLATYAVVCFTNLVQGSTIGYLLSSQTVSKD